MNRSQPASKEVGTASRTTASVNAVVAAASSDNNRVSIPIVEEQIAIAKRMVETGRVRITKTVREEQAVVDEPLLTERVDVSRVEVGRYVDEPPKARQEGDTLIIPIVEEVLVVEKRLLLREELHVRRQTEEIRNPQEVTLRRDEVKIERIDGIDAKTER